MHLRYALIRALTHVNPRAPASSLPDHALHTHKWRYTNLIDKKIVDTYTLGIDANGPLVASLASVPTDNSNSPSVNAGLNFFTDFNTMSTAVTTSVKNFVSTQLKDIPINIVKNYVFPGGKAFIFGGVGFSQYQDLVTFTRYADPTGLAVSVVLLLCKDSECSVGIGVFAKF